MSFPANFDTFSGTTAQGTSLLTSPDHGLDHRTLGSAAAALEQKIGLGSGTPQSNQVLVGGANNGTATWGTVWNGGSIGSAQVGGTGNFSAGTYTNSQLSGTANLAQGTVNLNVGTIGTLTTGSVVVPGTTNGLGFSAAIAPGVGTVTDVAGGTQTINAQLGNVFYSSMGTGAGNRTVGTILNPVPYGLLTLAYKSSGSANGTLVWGTVFRLSQDTGTPALGTGVGWNYFGWRYNSIDSKYDFVGQSKNLI